MPDPGAIIDKGRAAYPQVNVETDAIAPLVAQRLQGEDNPEQLMAEEIFLACACALGDSSAIAAFERAYFGVIPAALSRLALGRDEIAEIEQVLRVRLFVTDPDSETAMPRIVAYAGQGQLGGLLRVAAVRAGLNMLRDRGRLDQGADEGLEQVPIASDNPELVRQRAEPIIMEAVGATLPQRGLTAAAPRTVFGLSTPEATVRALLAGLSSEEGQAGLSTSIPENVKLLSYVRSGDTVTVTFSKELHEGVAGSCMVEAIRSQIEDTLLQFSGVSRVIIRVDGVPPGEELQP